MESLAMSNFDESAKVERKYKEIENEIMSVLRSHNLTAENSIEILINVRHRVESIAGQTRI